MKMTKQFKEMLDDQISYTPITTFNVEVWENNERPIVWERRMKARSPFFVLRVHPIVAITYGIKDGMKFDYWKE
jgi:hypothetical protein